MPMSACPLRHTLTHPLGPPAPLQPPHLTPHSSTLSTPLPAGPQDDEIISTAHTTKGRPQDPVLGSSRPPWAEHPALVPSLLDAARASLRDIRLDASYGSGCVEHDWADVPGGCVAAASFSEGRLWCRLLSVDHGACLAESSVECGARGLFTGERRQRHVVPVGQGAVFRLEQLLWPCRACVSA
jgi:hypothetical protein